MGPPSDPNSCVLRIYQGSDNICIQFINWVHEVNKKAAGTAYLDLYWMREC